MSGESVYKDLIEFLQSDRADLRLAASQAVLGVTDRNAMESLIKYGVIKPLCKLASRSNEIAGTNALASLVYLSSHGTSINQCIEDMLDCGGISRMTEVALSNPHDKTIASTKEDTAIDTWRKRVNFALALLANMTRTERGTIDLCGRSMPDEALPSSQIKGGHEEGQHDGDGDESNNINPLSTSLPSRPTMSLLLSRFVDGSYISDTVNGEDDGEDSDEEDAKTQIQDIETISAKPDDPYQHFAAVLMNATQVQQGRKFVMKLTSQGSNAKSTSVLEHIVNELRSLNPVRRRGVAGTIKNCCFEKDSSWWLINEVNIIPKILYPLAGPEELEVDEKRGMDPDLWLEGPDKVRESDQVTRLLLVEAILLLCATGRRSRESLRLQKTYTILKFMDMVEESEEISERINETVQFLRRDEEGTEEGSSDKFVDEAYGGNNEKFLALPAPSAAKQIGAKTDDDYDDVD
mmetsp:Transcript_3612/g.5248  ORF Transcript_3612/g.5248 Transcript_3612/m.5248 type:complete len:464 (+) Transcript_3612:123-1514(+)